MRHSLCASVGQVSCGIYAAEVHLSSHGAVCAQFEAALAAMCPRLPLLWSRPQRAGPCCCDTLLAIVPLLRTAGLSCGGTLCAGLRVHWQHAEGLVACRGDLLLVMQALERPALQREQAAADIPSESDGACSAATSRPRAT